MTLVAGSSPVDSAILTPRMATTYAELILRSSPPRVAKRLATLVYRPERRCRSFSAKKWRPIHAIFHHMARKQNPKI
jgi:hypothetical protein